MRKTAVAWLMMFLMGYPLSVQAATITAENSGGNWSATSTWVGGVVPDPVSDTAVIPATLTAAVTLNDSRTIPPTTVEDEVYGLVQGAGVTTTLGGDLIIGNDTGKDGMFTFGAGATLALDANNLVVNNANIRSNSTSGSWATVTGSGQITYSITGSKNSWRLSYVSFQNTGAHTYRLRDTTGSVTSEFLVSHCSWNGTGAVTIGTSGFTLPSVPITIDNNDFRDLTGDIIFYSTGNDPGANIQYFRYNTVRNASTKRAIAFPRKMHIVGNVFDLHYPTNANMGKGVFYDGNFFLHDRANSGTTILLQNQGSVDTDIFQNGYVYSPSTQLNSHGFTTGSTTGTAPVTVKDSVFEFYGTEPNLINRGAANINQEITGNIAFGDVGLSLLTIGSAVASGTTTIKQNTIVCPWGSASGLFLLENIAGSFAGTISISSNLLQPVSTHPQIAACNNAADTVTITASIYNAASAANQAAAYTYIDTISDLTGALYGVSANFAYPTRKLTAWDTMIGGDGTDTDAIAKLLAINGYNSTSKTQSDTPSGVSIYGTSTSLVDWVRAGFAPRNTALKGTGEGGVDIGAMPVVSGLLGIWGVGFGL